MTIKYKIFGMTCEGCVQSVTKKIAELEDVKSAVVSLANSEVEIKTTKDIPIESLQKVLGVKYTLEETETQEVAVEGANTVDVMVSKWVQLRPLFLIFTYILVAAIMLNMREWQLENAMYDFMGLFYIVFSFFKFLDLKGFPESFKMYDPLANKLPFYGKIYPFIELLLGLLFLSRTQLPLALLITILVLGTTTVGVAKSLLDKKTIRCACLGTVLKLPMTEATIIENMIMLLMAFYMLFTSNLGILS